MNNQGKWNRREFIVKPILWAGTASVLAKTDLLLASPSLETSASPVLQRTLGKTGLYSARGQHGSDERRRTGITAACV